LEDAELFVRQVVSNNLIDLEAIPARELERASGSDGELGMVRRAIADGSFDQMPTAVSRLYKSIADELCVLGRVVLRGNRIIIPHELQHKMTQLGHEGHLGVVGTKKNLRSRVWWPGIDASVERYVRQCKGCQLVGRAHERDPIRVTELPNGPWEDLACDLLGPLADGSHILVIVDFYSRYYECVFMQSTVSAKVIEVLEGVFSTHGLPLSLKSVNGPQFKSNEFSEYMTTKGIRHDLVTPRWPEANGEVERQNRSLMKRISIAFAEGKSVRKEVQKYLTAYRNSPHSITGKSPAEMLCGRKLRVKIPQVRDVFGELEERDRDAELKHQMVATRNKGKPGHDVEVGDLVLVLRDHQAKCQTPFHHDPFKVREICGSMLVVESADGRIFKRNITRIRPYCSPDSNPVVGAAEKVVHRDVRRAQDTEMTDVPEGPGLPPSEGQVSTTAEVPQNEPNQTPVREKRRPAYLNDYVDR
jgi:hypothetical protein